MTAAPKGEGGRGAKLFRLLLNPEHALLAVRMAAWRVALPCLTHTVPLGRLVPLAWAGARGRARRRDLEVTIARVEKRLYPRSGEGRCLERSLLVFRFLSLAGSNPRLVTGVAGTGAAVRGHAWVLVDGRPFNESTLAIEGYGPVFEFGDGGRLTSHGQAETARHAEACPP